MNNDTIKGGSASSAEVKLLLDEMKTKRVSCKLELNLHEGHVVRDRVKVTLPAGIVFDIARKFGLMTKKEIDDFGKVA